VAETDNTKKPLNALSVKSLKSGYLADTHPHSGLRLVVNKSGSKTWIYRYRSPIDNKLKQIKLGGYPAMSLNQARVTLIGLKADREAGIDLQERKREKKAKKLAESHADRQSVFTVSDMVDSYLENHIAQNRKPKGQAEVSRILRSNVKPVLGHLKPSDVTRSMVYSLMDSIIKRGAPVVAGQVVRELRAAFEKARNRDLIKDSDNFVNPCMGVETPAAKKSKRYLNDEEISKWLRWLPSSKMSRSVRDALMLVMYTGCRSGEVVVAEWRHIDLEGGTWFMAETKTDVERTVQLTKQAVALLKSRQNDCAFVFPSRGNRQPIKQKALVHAVCSEKDASGLDTWSSHDIRRTVRTGLSRMRCPSEVGEAVLGHSRKGIEGVYDLHKYEIECREWLQRWCNRLDTLAVTDNVVSLEGSRKKRVPVSY
jgi:integrase